MKVFCSTTDNWCGNYPLNIVEVSANLPTYPTYWRVSVFGNVERF